MKSIYKKALYTGIAATALLSIGATRIGTEEVNVGRATPGIETRVEENSFLRPYPIFPRREIRTRLDLGDRFNARIDVFYSLGYDRRPIIGDGFPMRGERPLGYDKQPMNKPREGKIKIEHEVFQIGQKQGPEIKGRFEEKDFGGYPQSQSWLRRDSFLEHQVRIILPDGRRVVVDLYRNFERPRVIIVDPYNK